MQRTTKALLIGISSLFFIGMASIAVPSLIHVTQHNIAPQTAAITPSKAQPPTVGELLKLVNEERAKAGVAPLMLDERLNTSAQMKADDMLKHDYYAHISPVTGKNSHDFIFNTGISCSDSSENIDENSSSLLAVTAWHNSPAHYAAMVDSKNVLTGFGIAGKDKNGYYLLVEHFCQQ